MSQFLSESRSVTLPRGAVADGSAYSGFPGRKLLGGLVPLGALGLAFLWPLEESHKLNTIVVLMVVCLLGWVLIEAARRAGIVESTNSWLFAFTLKLAVTELVAYIWVTTLGPHSHRFEWGVDPALWDLYGKWLAEGGMSYSVSSLFVRGHVLGIVWYIGFIYWVFGVSTLYVALVNALCCLVSVLCVVGVLVSTTRDSRSWQILRYGMFFPELVYHDGTPGKESLSVALFLVGFYCLVRLLERLEGKFLAGLALSVTALALVRPPLLIVLGALGIFLLLYKAMLLRVLRIALVSTALGLVLFGAAERVGVLRGFNFPEYLSGFIDFRERLSNAEEAEVTGDSVKRRVGYSLMIKDPMDVVTLGPIRAAVLLVAPFPQVLISPGNLKIRPGRNFEWTTNFNKLAGWAILLLLPYLAAAALQKRCRQCPAYPYIVVSFVVVLFAAAQSFALLHMRARAMADPLLMGAAAVGYRYGRPQVFRLPIFLLAFLALGVYHLVVH